jgi:small subunit ribosomal protein S5
MNNKMKGKKSVKPKSDFQERVIQIDRVNRVVAGGRRLRFRATVVVGDMKGRIGVGLGKADEVVVAVQKAVSDAKSNLFSVNLLEGTIPHETNAKYKASKVLLFPAPQGTGIIAGGAVRTVLELAGVRDILSKTHGSRNKINSSRSTIDALASLRKFKSIAPKKEAVVVETPVVKDLKIPAKPKAQPSEPEAKTKAPVKKAPSEKKNPDVTKVDDES